MSSIKELRELNYHLAELLNNPEPGLYCWRLELSTTLLKLAEYSGSLAVSELARVELAARGPQREMFGVQQPPVATPV